MPDDKPMKSAYELAMERLRKSDKDAGVAEIKTLYEAKLAELGILHQASLRKTFEPAERQTLEEEQRHERERLTAQRDEKIAQIKKG